MFAFETPIFFFHIKDIETSLKCNALNILKWLLFLGMYPGCPKNDIWILKVNKKRQNAKDMYFLRPYA